CAGAPGDYWYFDVW
nr:immunoglobulin heavy chain junction region [Mus musculus]